MLPPIPHSLVPVTAQQDVVKPRPDIPPVTPTNESSNESAVELDKRHPQEAEELMREEQRRRQRRGYTPAELAEGEVKGDDEKLLEELPRQGLWVDVEV
ncbi:MULTISPECIES: aspartate-semialdehyde dehydrogenase [unclassified Pseudomonas]|uniref:aspartate-semialdehyde dehydrogenase n=1 Tax=unclassified Pseudomonas TaxID=196821 RepID=UPI00244B7A2C|nr:MULTISPECIES: aspartate-semialdehyde dehydrogenase [unclassified Pseudomonas]MDG9928712.1 aspartate-semialdehyde dehydrogenase [Pseudomonas sp. GD04042]MDH0481781.1 aspartate-semialdehyde dehydrogenase [Pseudomonas sp. GD04015]MDH0603153.1 aspartate-semialdehyde dehydrogenase [Pseudomonas sp. GD03869]